MSKYEPTRSSSPVTVGWYLHPIEAEIARGRLESEGIPAFLHTQGHSQLDWPITLALGGIRLQVPPSAVGDAGEILASVEPLPDNAEEICPECGAASAVPDDLSWKIAFLAVHVVHVPLPFTRGKRKCLQCGTKWK